MHGSWFLSNLKLYLILSYLIQTVEDVLRRHGMLRKVHGPYLILSYPILSYLILSYLILSYRRWWRKRRRWRQRRSWLMRVGMPSSIASTVASRDRTVRQYALGIGQGHTASNVMLRSVVALTLQVASRSHLSYLILSYLM